MDESLEVVVDIPRKTLSVGGKPIVLESSLTDATQETINEKERVLGLIYSGTFAKGDPLAAIEGDKMREVYGESFVDEVLVSGEFLDDGAYQVSLYGNIRPVIRR